MRHGSSVTLTYCYRLYGLTAFSNRHAVLRKLYVCQQKRKFGTVVKFGNTLCVSAKTEIWNSCEIWKRKFGTEQLEQL